MNLDLDLTQVPFSRAGSYLALSLRDTDAERPWEQRPGDALYLRTLHGDRETDRVFRLEVLAPTGEPAPFTVDARPGLLVLRSGDERVECYITSDDALRVRGESLGLRLTLDRVGAYGSAQFCDREGRWLVNAWPARLFCRLTLLRGCLVADAPAANVLRARHVVADFLPEDADGGEDFEGLVETFATERAAAPILSPFVVESDAAASDFAAFLSGQPPVPDDLRQTAERAAYVQWASIVAPGGHHRRRAMLMSKNHMANVWSWDHCFNALALMPHDPELAWDQFLIPFDHQDAAGALPDSVNDATIVRGFTKPPIHGWTLRGLIERDATGFLTNERLAAVYEPLARWTRWWLRFRDQDGDGVPQYNHGNDSGWDNATAFDIGFPAESPDLCAYLILQMDLLADLARRQGEADEAARWSHDADDLLARMIAHSWREERACFVTRRSQSHNAAPAKSDSLLNFLPFVLGERLPAELRRPLIDGLLAPGRFLTDFGLASESLASSRYEPDGYWRGPVWAPPQLLIADGLRRMGETDAARTIAARFCRAVAQSGYAENFDARTGAGLRDRAYTWTASVFLVFAREYLTQPDLMGASA